MNVIIEEEVLVPDVPIIEEQVLYPSNPISVEEDIKIATDKNWVVITK